MVEDGDRFPVRTWLSVTVLGIAAFTMVTTEFAPIGLMTQMAVDLGESQAAIGLTVTLYAWFGALSGLIAPALVGRIPRKALLIGLMLIIALSNALVLLSHSLETLFFARLVGAVAHGVFWRQSRLSPWTSLHHAELDLRPPSFSLAFPLPPSWGCRP